MAKCDLGQPRQPTIGYSAREKLVFGVKSVRRGNQSIVD
jgi:hypothetical protein